MSNTSDQIIIREATKADALAVFSLIRELCVFEGEKPEDTIKITESEFVEDGFGSNPSFGCLVAEDRGSTDQNCERHSIVGHALYSKVYSAWKGKSIYLDDLYIKKEQRGKGIGKRMMKKLAEIALENSFKLIFFCCSRGNVTAQNLYDTIGSTCIDRWAVRYWEVPEMKAFIAL